MHELIKKDMLHICMYTVFVLMYVFKYEKSRRKRDNFSSEFLI